VTNKTGDGAVIDRSGHPIGLANTLLVGRAALDELRSAVGERVRHASLFLRVEKTVNATHQLLLL